MEKGVQQCEREGQGGQAGWKAGTGEGREGADVCGVCVACSDNKIGDAGAKGIGDGLHTNSTLQRLNLAGAYGGRGGGRDVGRSGSGKDGETKGVGIARGEGCLRAGY